MSAAPGMQRYQDSFEQPLLDAIAAEATSSRIAAGELPGVAELSGLADAIGVLELIRDIPTLSAVFDTDSPGKHEHPSIPFRPAHGHPDLARGEGIDVPRHTP